VANEALTKDIAVASNLIAGRVMMRIAEGTEHVQFGVRVMQGDLHCYDAHTPSQGVAVADAAPPTTEDEYELWLAADPDRVRTELRVEIAGTLAETFFRDAWARNFVPRGADDRNGFPVLDVDRAYEWAAHLAVLCGAEDVDSEAWVVKETELIFKLVAHHIQAIDKLAEAIANNSVHDDLLTTDDVRAIHGDLEVFRLRREWKHSSRRRPCRTERLSGTSTEPSTRSGGQRRRLGWTSGMQPSPPLTPPTRGRKRSTTHALSNRLASLEHGHRPVLTAGGIAATTWPTIPSASRTDEPAGWRPARNDGPAKGPPSTEAKESTMEIFDDPDLDLAIEHLLDLAESAWRRQATDTEAAEAA